MNSFVTFSRQFPLTLPSIWNRGALLQRKTVNELKYSTLRERHCRQVYTSFQSLKHLCKDIVKQKIFMSTSVLDVNTKVAKDVILFHYENPKYFRIVNIFAISQFGFWTYLSHFAYTSLKDAPPPKDTDDVAWWRKMNLGENKYRNGLTILSFLIGYGILTVAWLFTLKSVRYLVLRKGGEKITFVTYTPLGKNRMLTVNVNMVSCQEARHNAHSQLPIKVKGQLFFYILDMKGEFRNPKLFDSTAGLRRTWNN